MLFVVVATDPIYFGFLESVIVEHSAEYGLVVGGVSDAACVDVVAEDADDTSDSQHTATDRPVGESSQTATTVTE